MRTTHFFLAILVGLMLAVGSVLALRGCAAEKRRETAKRLRRSPRHALGPLAPLPPRLRQAFTPGPHFRPLPRPRPGEWLAEHPERGQTYDEFVRGAFNQPTRERRTLVIQPIGDFPPDRSPELERLREYAAAYFQLPVVLLPPLAPDGLRLTSRKNPSTGKRQILTGDVLARLRERLSNGAYASVAVTMIDLYPDPSWNFVFGQASFRRRVGVFSFARYDPAFYGQPRQAGWKRLLLRRSMKVLVHETGHMFGLYHCIHYRCAMNGSNHLQEDDRVPLHLCPICLRKLHHAVRFDPTRRYAELATFYEKVGLLDDARFAAKRRRWIGKAQRSAKH